MPSSYASNAVLSKARAMYGNRIKSNDYRELLNCNNVSEVALYLKYNTNYGAILSDLDESDIHRGELENLLRKRIFHDFAKLGRYELSAGEDLAQYMILRTEIEQIIHALILLISNKSEEYIYNMPTFFNKHTHVDLPSFSKVRNYDDFLAVLKGSPYYKILKQFKPEDSKKIDLNKIENALYTYMYDQIFNIVESYKNKSIEKELSEMFNLFVDLHNFVRVLRLKKYYKASPAMIKQSILPFGLFRKKHIQGFIDAQTADEVIKVIKTTWLGGKLRNIKYNYADDVPEIMKYRKSRHNIRFSINPPVVMLSYIFLTEIELSNIINIIEGVRYGLSAEEIRELLIYSEDYD